MVVAGTATPGGSGQFDAGARFKPYSPAAVPPPPPGVAPNVAQAQWITFEFGGLIEWLCSVSSAQSNFGKVYLVLGENLRKLECYG